MEAFLIDLVYSRKTLARLFDTAHPPARLSYQLARLQRALQPIFADYDSVHLSLLEKYGTSTDTSGQYSFSSDDKRIAFDKEYMDLVNQTVRIPLPMLKLQDVDDLRMDKSLTPSEVATLMWLVGEEPSANQDNK